MKKILANLLTLMTIVSLFTPFAICEGVEAEVATLSPLSELLGNIQEITGYYPEYTCEYSDENQLNMLTIHFANGIDYNYHHWHSNDECLINKIDADYLMSKANDGYFNYEWHPVIGKTYYANDGAIKIPGIWMPFEFGFSEYNNSWMLAYFTQTAEVDINECISPNADIEHYMVPTMYMAQVYYAHERAEAKYFEEHPEELEDNENTNSSLFENFVAFCKELFKKVESTEAENNEEELYTFLEDLTASQDDFITLTEVFEKVWEDRVYGHGLLSITVTFTEADSVLLEATVDADRVDYHMLQLDEWYIDINGHILVSEEAVEKLVSNPANPS